MSGEKVYEFNEDHMWIWLPRFSDEINASLVDRIWLSFFWHTARIHGKNDRYYFSSRDYATTAPNELKYENIITRLAKYSYWVKIGNWGGDALSFQWTNRKLEWENVKLESPRLQRIAVYLYAKIDDQPFVKDLDRGETIPNFKYEKYRVFKKWFVTKQRVIKHLATYGEHPDNKFPFSS